MKTYMRRWCLLTALGIFLSLGSLSVKAQEGLAFSNMLLPKANVDYLMSSAAKLGKLVFVQINSTKDVNRRLYQLVVYAYNDKNKLIATYMPFMLTASSTDSVYFKDIYISSYTMTKSALSALIPSQAYSFMRFRPFNDAISEDLRNYISYSVFAVGADGVTGVKKSTSSTATVATLQLNPSPPR